MQFGDIFKEYYAIFRGQATSIPSYGDREFTLAVHLANNAIKKWERVDGTLWRELYTSAALEPTSTWGASDRTIVDGTISYTAPSNMRKPPASVFFYTGDSYKEITVIKPEEISGLNELEVSVTFLGSANSGFTMRISPELATQYAGYSIDYLYFKKATLLSITSDPSSTSIEMSDPNFIIQDMLVSRYTNERNGFGVKVADAAAKDALINMKIENASGVPGRSDNLDLDFGGWGTSQPAKDIKL